MISIPTPPPEFFRRAAVLAASGEQSTGIPPDTRYWCELTLGAKGGLIGFGDFKAPNHARVISASSCSNCWPQRN